MKEKIKKVLIKLLRIGRFVSNSIFMTDNQRKTMIMNEELERLHKLANSEIEKNGRISDETSKKISDIEFEIKWL